MINLDYLKFFGIGNLYELKNPVNLAGIKKYCDESDKWVSRGKGIHTLSLTSLDGTLETAVGKGLKYMDGLNDASFRTITEHFTHIASQMPLLYDLLPVLGRTRIFKAEPCGVWEPHRDGSSVIRIIVPISDCNWENFRLMLEDKVLRIEHGRAYVTNTLLEHAAVCFDRDAYIMVITVLPTDETAKILYKHMSIK